MPLHLKRFRLGYLTALLGVMLMGSMWLHEGAHAQNVSDFLNLNNPVEYDPVRQVGRARQRPDSIDQCLFRKEWFFNELHNIWVEGLERCKRNSKRILSRASGANPDASNVPADEQACVGKGDGSILTHGVPSESQARGWSDHCSYLGTIGGAGPQGVGTSSGSNYDLYFNSQGGQPVGITGTNRAPSGSSGSVAQQPLTGTQLQDTQTDLKNFLEGGFKPTYQRRNGYFSKGL